MDQSTRTSPLDRAKSLHGLISEAAETSERLGRIEDGVAGAMLEARLFSILVPERDGGLGAGRRAFFEAVEEIASADGSAGWCASVCNAVGLAASRGLPQEGRDEVFGHGPVACWTSLYPNAVVTQEPGGFRITCPGSFGSGSSLSQWVNVAGNVGAAHEGRYRAFLVPKSEVEIKAGSWDVMGLRATASLDYAITDRFVPARLSWEYEWAPKDGGGPMSAAEGARLNAVGLSAFASGIGRRALSELIASAKKTKRVAAEGVQADDNVVQLGIGELEGRIRAARAHLVGLLEQLDDGTASDDTALDVTQATHTLARASRDMVVFAFDHSGTSVIHARQPVQRCLRDIFTGLKHASFTPALLGRIGKVRLGLPFGGQPL